MSGKRRWLTRIGLGMGVFILVLLATGMTLTWCLNFHPDPSMEVVVHCKGSGSSLQPGEKFSLLAWNIQYGASRKYHFWYDGGDAVRVKKGDVYKTLESISETIAKNRPDILCLQEVDRNSSRTHGIDQLPQLLKTGPMHCSASSTYHRSRYVPVPIKSPLGRVDMHLVTASTYPISSSVRYALPQLDEFFIRRAFNLKRALLETRIPITGRKKHLVVLNTHLSAFSYGDGTLSRQIKVIEKRIEEIESEGSPWILTGDFNMIPPGEDPSRLGPDAHYYSEKRNPLKTLFKHYQPGVTLQTYRENPALFYTYLRFGAKKPDRKIDYIFTSRNIKIHEFRVIHQQNPTSDHLPLWIVASLK